MGLRWRSRPAGVAAVYEEFFTCIPEVATNGMGPGDCCHARSWEARGRRGLPEEDEVQELATEAIHGGQRPTQVHRGGWMGRRRGTARCPSVVSREGSPGVSMVPAGARATLAPPAVPKRGESQ